MSKPRNKVSNENDKVSENTGKQHGNVKYHDRSAIIDEIVERLANGEPLRQICRDEKMPGWRIVYDWMDADKEIAARIASGRELGEEAILADCLRIADDGKSDIYLDSEGRERADMDHIQRSKLRIETRLKLLAKWNPKKWGERMQLAGDPAQPLQVKSTLNVSALSTSALAEILAAADAAKSK